jgi:hypothetical protein
VMREVAGREEEGTVGEIGIEGGDAGGEAV